MRKFFDFFGVGDEWREVCAYFAQMTWWERAICAWAGVSVLSMVLVGDGDAWLWPCVNGVVSLIGVLYVQMRHESKG